MSKKLYVGNLSFSVTSRDLEQMFSAHGAVSSTQLVTDRSTGESKGFAFVEMTNDSEANAAISALNGTDLEGRSVIVNEARPREDKPRGFGSGGRGGFGTGRRY
jgi:cold-inducible RNA-binding protein